MEVENAIKNFYTSFVFRKENQGRAVLCLDIRPNKLNSVNRDSIKDDLMDVTESESIVIEPISPGLLISFTFNLMPIKDS